MTSTADRNYQQFNTQCDEIIEQMDAGKRCIKCVMYVVRSLDAYGGIRLLGFGVQNIAICAEGGEHEINA